ncbi:MAG: DnaJ domain-containing protein [SAR324 cluster bacterium]|nr:DnaJ domain-containing protein [SAR324 cluster bacterium]
MSSRPNYYAIFGIPYTYNIRPKQLELMFHKLATELHPDFYLTATPDVKKQSEEASALLNRAYETLRSPGTRAAYLMGLLAQDQHLDEKQLPEGFLEHMFELQENLDEQIDNDNKQAIAEMKTDIETQWQNLLSEYPTLFSELERENPLDPKQLQTIQTHLNAERYLKRLLERIALYL